MNKKIVTLIIVILVSFCFLGIVVADNATNDDNSTTDPDQTIDNDNVDDDKKDDKTTVIDNTDKDKDKKDDKSKKNYILAKGKGNDIKFSDGFRGFILDYSKSPAKPGDEYKAVSTSHASNSNALKLAVIECYKQNSADQIGKVLKDFIKSGSSNTKVGEAVAASHDKLSDHVILKLNEHSQVDVQFEVLKSVSGNESDYFAYKASFTTLLDESTNNETNETRDDTVTNITNVTNVTNVTFLVNNETNGLILNGLYDYLDFLANSLFSAWKPIIDTLANDFLMVYNALEGLGKSFGTFLEDLHTFMGALQNLLNMVGPLFNQLSGILKMVIILLNSIGQLLNLIMPILDFVSQLLPAIISLVQQIIGLLQNIISFIGDIINQLASLGQAIFDYLKTTGSFLANVIGNGALILISFVIITVGAFVYNRQR